MPKILKDEWTEIKCATAQNSDIVFYEDGVGQSDVDHSAILTTVVTQKSSSGMVSLDVGKTMLTGKHGLNGPLRTDSLKANAGYGSYKCYTKNKQDEVCIECSENELCSTD